MSVHAQAIPWVDSATNVTFSRFYVKAEDIGYGYVFPPLPAAGQPAADEFIGIFTAPIAAGWVGNALGPGMKNNLLILGWVSGTTPVLSTRYATCVGYFCLYCYLTDYVSEHTPHLQLIQVQS